ncbi:hypothetical protein SEPCBS57363_001183 [Sporothrix epigloea]|uniref:Zinc finger, RING/FYVE/PHD-type n=1 Tax=Sporothrix epigloea TaxID=1892477 RepID=A0ABP0D8V0_9PEZI
MSSPAQGGPSAPKEKKAGVGSRVLTRMKTIMKKTEKRMSVSGPKKADTSPATPAAAPAEAATPAAVVTSNDAPTDKINKTSKESPETVKIPRTQLYEDRARKLGERFGLEIKPSEWHSTEGDALRVNKPIRMRVHRTCHQCSTDFGTAKECTSCKHVRCKLCTRYPAKRNETEKQAARERRAVHLQKQKENAPIIADWEFPVKPMILTKPSKTGGQVLVYKKPRQRYRRNCCQCDKLILSGDKTCTGCGHSRCTDCPRDPAKKDKYPYGYPGDEFGTRSIPRFKCHECKIKYPVEAAEGTSCTKCSHPRCAVCPRLKPQRVEPDPDPEILKTIETRLSKLRMG